MTFSLPNFRIGEAMRYEGAAVFPLHSDGDSAAAYRLASEAIADGAVIVKEVNKQGSVPELLVKNKGDAPVLFLEGEELIGAKQNRALNASALVAAKTKTVIPVSCVEQGRWRSNTQHFGHGGWHTSSRLRAIIRRSVNASTRSRRGHRSDQCGVWMEIQKLQDAHGVRSPTSAMADVIAAIEKRLAEFNGRFPYPSAATGMVVCIGDRIVMMDAFDCPQTCEATWDRLLSSVAVDAIESKAEGKLVAAGDVRRFLDRVQAAGWDKTEAVSEGCEYRCELTDGESATALTLGGALIHGSVVSIA